MKILETYFFQATACASCLLPPPLGIPLGRMFGIAALFPVVPLLQIVQTLPVHDAKGHTYMPTFYACTNPATLPSAQTQNSQEQQQQHQQQQPQQHFQQGWWHVVTCYSHPDETERSTELVNASALSTAAAEPSACTMVERRPERAVSRSCGICSSARRNLPHCTCLKPYLVRPCSGCAYHLWPGCRPLINLGQLVRQVPYKHNRTRRLLDMVRKDRWVVQ